MLFFAAPMLPAAVYLAGLWRVATPRRHRRGWYLRVDAFARANGLAYLPGEPRLRRVPIPLPYATVSDVVLARDDDDTVQFSNFHATSAAGGRTRRGGAVITRLDHPLPNTWLQSRRHARIAFFGRLQRRQRLSLEGGFDRHFAMFVPRGYERDALYLFTPDILALLIDHVADFDVELSGTRLVLSGPRDVVTLDARRWEDARIAIASLRSKTAQWARWRDEHPTDDGGAPQLGDEVRPSGRRLRRSTVIPYTLTVVAAAGWLLLGLMMQTS